MSSPLFIDVANLTESTNNPSVCTTKCSLTLNYLPNNMPKSITSTNFSKNSSFDKYIYKTLEFNSLSTTSSTSQPSSTSQTSSTNQTLSNIYIGGNTSNPFALDSLTVFYPPLNNYVTPATKKTAASNTYKIVGEIYIKHVYLNNYAYIIIPISNAPSGTTVAAPPDITLLKNTLDPTIIPTPPTTPVNLYNIFNTVQHYHSVQQTSTSNNYQYYKWNSYELSKFSSSDSNNPNNPINSTYFLINPKYAININTLKIAPSLPPPYTSYMTSSSSSSASVLGSTDTFTIINSNPTISSSSDSPYYMVCQSSNYSDATNTVTVNTSIMQQMISDTKSYFNSNFMSSIDNTIWNVIYNVIITVVIIVFLIYLFTKFGAYMKKNQDD